MPYRTMKKNIGVAVVAIGLLLGGAVSGRQITCAAQALNDTAAEGQSRAVYALTLEETSRLALRNNFDIQLAKYDTLISRTSLGQAEAIYDTILEASVGYRNNQNKPTSSLLGSKSLENNYDVGLSKKFSSGSTVSADSNNNRSWSNSAFSTLNPTHDASLQLTLQQDLGKNFFGLQDRGRVALTQVDIQAAEYTTLDKITAHLAQVQEAYWDLVLAYEQLGIEQHMVEQAKRLWEVNQENEVHGLVEKPDVLAAEANYKEQLNQLLLAENQLQTKKNVLYLMLNITEEQADIKPLDVLSVDDPLPDLTQSLKDAFDNRYDYKQVMTSVKSYDLRLSLKKNALWPEINLKTSLARNGVDDHFSQAFEQVWDEDNPDFYAGLHFRIPLENREAKAGLESVKLEKARILVALKLLERQIAVGIVDQVRLCHVLKEIALNAGMIAGIQEQKLAEEEKRFSSGRSDTDTVIRFQQDLLRSKLTASEARFNYKVSLLRLQQLQGTLLDVYWDGEI